MPSGNPLNIFVSYANQPADRGMLEEINTLLHTLVREGKIDIWDDSKLRGGEHLHETIQNEIAKADMFLLLLSPDFLRSDYICEKELPLIFQRSHPINCPVIPIYLRYCSWEDDKRISEKAIIPKKVDEELKPVEFWDKREEALSVVNIKLREIIFQLHKKKLTSQQIDANDRVLIPQLNVATIWQSIPIIDDDWGLVRTVDCDRDEEYTEALLADFLEKENDDCNLIYFISACETQNPESIAKRLVYHCDDVFTTYPASSEHEILVQDLKIERRPEETWIRFWRVFNDSFSLSHPDFDDFALNSDTFTKSHKRIPFFCTVKEHHWTKTHNLEAHLQLIIERFSTLPSGCHKFVLFFILEFEKFHNYYQDAEARCNQRLQKIAGISLEKNHCTILPHIKQINLFRLVEEEAVIVWLKEIIDRTKISQTLNNVISQIIEILVAELDDYERQMYIERKVFNMQRLEMMQRHIYKYVSQLKNQRQIA